ncbi:GNAT family N-acetyltransferase [Yinghuangia sp. ASG 101]|uniref:GNAT family N-acetyltransferase n=1 Tax=Yinghuangia sp. ASG 101 TaxID=2896848 RepID=UPI001E3F866F|nr:GNAT family N-acetyltransferase [Yinghuangia sp. ASG 101]UGQ14587.1 GNAT family N-acetyltransferase [Yinghuangia sp. ASG 101]
MELVDIGLPDGASGGDAEPVPGPAASCEPRIARLRAEVSALAPRAEQLRFSGRASATLPVADLDPFRTPYAVVHDGHAVGFGVLDVRGYPDEVAGEPLPAVVLRSFYIGARWQGRGLGGAAIRELPRVAAKLAPDAGVLLLTVNVRNAGAVRAYLAGGFVDEGRLYMGGDAGPQHVLRHELGRT